MAAQGPGGSLPPEAVLTYRLKTGALRSQLGSALVLSGQARLLDLAQLLDETLDGPWVFTGIQTLELTASGPGTAVTTFVGVPVEANGAVKDVRGLVLPAPNRSPVANAGPDLPGVALQPVTLEGSASDPDGDVLTYRWTGSAQNPAVASLVNDTSLRPTFTPSIAGLFRFTLTVTDSRQATVADTMAVSVVAATGTGNDHASAADQTGPGDTLISSASPDSSRILAGVVGSGTESDWFVFYALRGRTYTIELLPGSLASAQVRLYASDGSTVLKDLIGVAPAAVTLSALRPQVDGFYYVRVKSGDGAATGGYNLRALVGSDQALQPPPASVTLSRSSGSYRAVIHTAGTTQLVSDLNVLVEYDGGRLRLTNTVSGPAASEFQSSFPPTLPTLLALSLHASPAKPVPSAPSDVLGTLDFAARAGTLPDAEALSLLSIAATNSLTSVEIFRPAADAGLSQSVLTAAGTGPVQLQLDGRRSLDSNEPPRILTYRWQQTGGTAGALSSPSVPTPTFTAPGPGLYRLGLTVSNGVLASSSSTVSLGVDLPRAAPFASLRGRAAVSTRLSDFTTAPLVAAVGTGVVLDAALSGDPRGRRPLSYAWEQLQGPTVDLAAATSTFIFTPAQAGRYDLRLTVTNADGLTGRPVVGTVVAVPGGGQDLKLALTAVSGSARGEDLGDAPELAAARSLRTQVGQPVTLSALVSGGSPGVLNSFYWRQLAGPAVSLSQRGGAEDSDRTDSYVDFAAREPGVHEFTCRLRQGLTGAEVTRNLRVSVDRAASAVPGAFVGAAPGTAKRMALAAQPVSALSAAIQVAPGTLVALSAAGSSASSRPLTYRWVQVFGPDVALSDAAGVVTTFVVPALEGERLYAFHLFTDDGLRSEPAVVTVQTGGRQAVTTDTSLNGGLNLISVPLDASVGRPYELGDLALDTGSTFVGYLERPATGPARFKTWLRGSSGPAPVVRPGEAYFVSPRVNAPGRAHWSGTAWPVANAASSLAPGMNLLGRPAEDTSAVDIAALLSTVNGRFAVRWSPAAGGRTRAEVFLPGFGLPGGNRAPGQGLMVWVASGAAKLPEQAHVGAALAAARGPSKGGLPPAASPPSETHTYRLRRDWNLVSLALGSTPAIEHASDLAAGLSGSGAQVTRLLRWNGTGFDAFTPGSPAAGTDFPVLFGEGYFAYNAGAPATVLVTGTERPGVLVSLRAGYTVLSSPLGQPIAAGDLLSAVGQAGGDAPFALSHAGSRFLANLSGAPSVSSAFNLERGRGLVVNARKASSLTIGVVPLAPQIQTGALPSEVAGRGYSAQLEATGTTPIAWTLAGGALPDGLALTETGAIAGTPTRAATFDFTVRASNLIGPATRQYTIVITPAPVGPTIGTARLPDATRGVAYSAGLAASGTPPITWSLVSGTLPGGLNLDSSGLVTGTPSATVTATFTVRASNEAGSITGQVTLVVVPPIAPTILTTSLQDALFDTSYSATLAATGTAPFTWSLVTGSSLPAGLALDSAGSISGTPTATGIATFTVQATNLAGSKFKQLTLAVRPSAPRVETAALPNAVATAPYSQQLAARGSPPFTWSLASETLPDGFTLAASGSLYGTPAAPGLAVFTVRVTNTVGSVTRPLTLTVDPAPPVAPHITTVDLPRGAPNWPYAGQLGASGTPPFVWTLVAGDLPAGLTLSGTGAIAGTPSALVQATFTVQVENAASTDLRQLSLTVGAAIVPAILTAEPPVAFAGRSYSASLSASGTPPVWSLASGVLPGGLALASTGAISGTPVATGSATFTVRATNPAGADQRALTLRVLSPPTYLATNSKGYREYRNEKDGSVLIEVPAGTFAMGTAGQTSGEGPQHEVRLSTCFIGKYEVTNAQYAAFLAATSDPAGPTQHGGHHPAEGASKDHTPGSWNGHGDATPVIYVDWYDCYAYCAWAGLALPTEAQWECAARGRDGRTYPWGNDAPDAGSVYRANYYAGSNGTADGYQYTAPVGSFGAGATSPRADGTSPVGALDMAGNVWEWCFDWYDGSYYGSQTTWNGPAGPVGPLNKRLLRGGAWSGGDNDLRAASRGSGLEPSYSFNYDVAVGIGVRVSR